MSEEIKEAGGNYLTNQMKNADQSVSEMVAKE
jgi:hypothetical protein